MLGEGREKAGDGDWDVPWRREWGCREGSLNRSLLPSLLRPVRLFSGQCQPLSSALSFERSSTLSPDVSGCPERKRRGRGVDDTHQA